LRTEYALSRLISYVCLDDRVTVIDFKAGRYFGLNSEASALWLGLVGDDSSSGWLVRFEQRFSVSSATAQTWLREFACDCLNKNWIAPLAGNGAGADLDYPPPRRWLGPPAARAWFAMAAVAVGLRRDGLAAILASYRKIAGRSAARGSIEQALAAFRRAEGAFLFASAPRDCLPRSLALFRFLASEGHPVTHHIGIRRHPFSAHAWVAINGETLLDIDAAAFTAIATMSVLTNPAHD
jgi:Transglutaminase-like superfamily